MGRIASCLGSGNRTYDISNFYFFRLVGLGKIRVKSTKDLRGQFFDDANQ